MLNKKINRIFPVVITSLMATVSVSVAAQSSSVPQDPVVSQGPTRIVDGSQTPDAIPDLLAWKNFYLSVDWQYRRGRGFLYGFINLRLRIGGFLRSDPEAGELIFRTLADNAALALRDWKMYDGESQVRRRSLELGGLNELEFEVQEEQALREKIAMMQRSVESLRAEILRLSPRHGKTIWRAIRHYVLTTTKSSMSVTTYGEGPSRHEQIMFDHFRTPPP